MARRNKKCPDCNKMILEYSKRCLSCAQKERFKRAPIWNKGIPNTWYNPKGLEIGWKLQKRFVKGQVAPMKGKKRLDIVNEKHFSWKGEDASYGAKHTWVSRKLGKPLLCSHCNNNEGTTRNFHWHNISKEYKRDLSDWIRLCSSCHKKEEERSYFGIFS